MTIIIGGRQVISSCIKSEELKKEVFIIKASILDKERWISHQPTVRSFPKIGRNNPCPCGSGKKYKRCCLK